MPFRLARKKEEDFFFTFSSAASAGCQSKGPPPRPSPQNLSPECQAFLETVALQQGQRREARSPVFVLLLLFWSRGHSREVRTKKKKGKGTAVFPPLFRSPPSKKKDLPVNGQSAFPAREAL